MEIKMDPLQKQMLDDVFDAFSMLAGGNFVSLMHVEGGVTRWSPGAVELFNLPGEYIPNGAMDWGDYVHPEDRKRYLDVMIPLAGGEQHTYDITYRVRTKSGEYSNVRNIGSVLRNGAGAPSLIGGILINQGLMSNTDPITVLRNKYGFYEDLTSLVQEDRNIIILQLGIRKLSHINQVYGYSYGNRVLQEVAWLIQQTVGQRGSIYRMDDAAFAVMTGGIPAREIAAIYDSLRLKLQRGIRVDGIRHNLSAAGSLISAKDLHMDAATIHSCLNAAYKESKERRHGDLVDFNGSINYDARESLELINVIRDCIMEGCRGFSVKYQPVFDAKTGRLIGAEALLRWADASRGEVLPQEFIPILETDFVFEELGGWLLHTVMADGVEFLKRLPDFLLGLNISPVQLEDEYFIDSLFQTMEQTGFPAKNLCLELTKGCRLLELDRLNDTVAALHRKGIRILIDDFGSGLDSITFLKELSADLVKFDLAFLENIEENEQDRKAVLHLAELASIYGPNVCVKGVETEGMRDILQTFPITSVQGNYFSEPLDKDALAALAP